jgi:hypothetical protein
MPSRRKNPAREIRQAAVGSFLEFGRSDRSLLAHSIRAFTRANQLGNIPACRMITFTFRDRSIALKETFYSTFDPPDATITLG